MRLVLKREAGRAHVGVQDDVESEPPIRCVPVVHAGGAGGKVELGLATEHVVVGETVGLEEKPVTVGVRAGGAQVEFAEFRKPRWHSTHDYQLGKRSKSKSEPATMCRLSSYANHM